MKRNPYTGLYPPPHPARRKFGAHLYTPATDPTITDGGPGTLSQYGTPPKRTRWAAGKTLSTALFLPLMFFLSGGGATITLLLLAISVGIGGYVRHRTKP